MRTLLRIHSTIFLSIFVLLTAPNTVTAETVEKIVATVNGTAITMLDLDQAMKTYTPQKEEKLTGTGLRARVLDKLIDDKILENALKKSGVKVEPNEVDSYIDQTLRSSKMTNEALQADLQKKGMALEQFREKIHDQILKNKFIGENIGRKVTVTEAELKTYFDNHMDEFKSISSMRLSQISMPFTQNTKQSDLEKMHEIGLDISKAAKTTSNFEALAKQFSGKPFEVQGGDLGVVKFQDLHPTIAQAASQLDVGQVSPPILTNTGVHIIKVTDRTKTSTSDFTSLREEISSRVYDVKIQDALKEYVKGLRKNAQIEIKGLGLN